MTIRLSRNERMRRQKRLAANLSKTMTVYHFSSLCHFDGIVKEGIRRGEVPIEGLCYLDRPQAANVTTVPSRIAQMVWTRYSALDKARLRFTISLRRDELVSFDEVRRETGMSSSWVKSLSPNGEHRHWYFARKGIPLTKITCIEIDLDQDGQYVKIDSIEVKALADLVTDEKKRVGFSSSAGQFMQMSDGSTLLCDSKFLRVVSPSVLAKWPCIPLRMKLAEDEIFQSLLTRTNASKRSNTQSSMADE